MLGRLFVSIFNWKFRFFNYIEICFLWMSMWNIDEKIVGLKFSHIFALTNNCWDYVPIVLWLSHFHHLPPFTIIEYVVPLHCSCLIGNHVYFWFDFMSLFFTCSENYGNKFGNKSPRLMLTIVFPLITSSPSYGLGIHKGVMG